MKNINKIMIFILFSFIFVNDINALSTYVQAESIASNFLKNSFDFKNTFNRYLYTNQSDMSLFYNKFDEANFEYGGLLSYDEFLITKNGRVNNEYSYLYGVDEYWTYTSNGDKKYIVSNEIDKYGNKDDVNDRYNIRVTEIVRPDSTIVGSGTYSDPWVFEPRHFLTFVSNSASKGKISDASNFGYDEKLELIVSSDSNKEIFIKPEDGFEYLGNTCGAILNDIDLRNGISNKLKVLGVSRDLECVINFGEKSYKNG